MKDPSIAKDLGSVEAHHEFDILSYFVMGPEKVSEFSKNGDINSDDYPIIELRAPKSMTRRRTWFRNLQELMSMRESPLPFTRNSGQSSEEAEAFSSKLKNIYEAVGTVVQGQLLNVIPYQFQEEYRYYLKAADIYPENRAIQRFKDLAESRALILLGGESLERERCNEALGYYEMFGFLRDRFLCATVRGSRKYIYD